MGQEDSHALHSSPCLPLRSLHSPGASLWLLSGHKGTPVQLQDQQVMGTFLKHATPRWGLSSTMGTHTHPQGPLSPRMMICSHRTGGDSHERWNPTPWGAGRNPPNPGQGEKGALPTQHWSQLALTEQVDMLSWKVQPHPQRERTHRREQPRVRCLPRAGHPHGTDGSAPIRS